VPIEKTPERTAAGSNPLLAQFHNGGTSCVVVRPSGWATPFLIFPRLPHRRDVPRVQLASQAALAGHD
jgi:hypothetical protein